MLEIFTLGGLEIRLGGRPLASLANHKAGTLLCYLAVTGQSRSRAALSGLLWGEATESNARAYLRQALARLRREVAAHVTITHHQVAFNRQAPHWLDVQAFEERLRRAAGLRESPLTSLLRQAPLRQAQGADAEGANAEGADLLAGAVDLYRGAYARAGSLFQESLVLRRRSGDRRGIAASLMQLSHTTLYQGRADESAALAEQGIEIYRAVGDQVGAAQGVHDVSVRLGFLGHYPVATSAPAAGGRNSIPERPCLQATRKHAPLHSRSRRVSSPVLRVQR